MQKEVLKFCTLVGCTPKNVEQISRNLRPSVLRELGLVAVLRQSSAAFTERTGVVLKVTCAQPTAVLHPDTELAFYRIIQEALNNVEKHARATCVTVGLEQRGTSLELAISDDGVGCVPDHHLARQRAKHRFGLLGMRERAASVGGAFRFESAPGKGTTIRARLPFGRGAGLTM